MSSTICEKKENDIREGPVYPDDRGDCVAYQLGTYAKALAVDNACLFFWGRWCPAHWETACRAYAVTKRKAATMATPNTMIYTYRKAGVWIDQTAFAGEGRIKRLSAKRI